MEYRRFENVIILRLNPGEEICESILEIAGREHLKLAEISGLGAVNELTTGVYDVEHKQYHSNSFAGAYEIVSLTGTITEKDGMPYLHAHISAGDAEGHVIGGHLNKAVISATAEIVIRVYDGEVGRVYDEGIGLNLMQF